jgi:class 3 adenylate cyclase
MNCPHCQHENPVGVKFCGECGTRLEAACPTCGSANLPGDKFCGQCGASLVEPIASTKFQSPKTYTPKHLAEKILISTSAVAGQRKQVTVLFADIKGSMELLADRDPEEARKVLDPVIDRMMEAVHRYDGTVNQVMGDGIMALFGAPLGHEDHAVRACYAALRMQDSVKSHADDILRTEGIPIQIRVGLNSGEVVVGSIGNDLKMDYTAIGQTTHLAARMEQMAMPGSILITLDTLRLAEGFVQVKSIGLANVKGLSQPVELYEVTGAGPVRSRFKTAAARGLNRFIGRDTEMDQLHKALEQAVAGHGQVVAVVGEPGVGKSRLFYEFTHSDRTGGCLIVESGAVSYRKASPYGPVIDLLKTYFKIQDRDNQHNIAEKITAKLLTLDKSLESTLPAFLTLLDLPVEDAHWQGLDPPQRRQQTFDAVKRLLLKQSQVQSLILVFEDLHWVDSETQALLDNLVDTLPTARLLLLVDYRPEYHHGWANKTYYTQLRIDPLSRENAQGFLRDLVGNDIALQPLKESLVDRTEGNPFFLEEIVRTLVETKVLGGERGAYHLTKALEEIQVPARVQAVLAARIDRLPPEEKQLLESASVIGENVPFSLLQLIAETSEEQLRRGFAHLQAAEFVYETSLFPELEYTFRHGLTYQVAYNSLLQEHRRALHARLVTSIESIYAYRITEQVERLAHHAVRGEVWNKAVAYLCQAGKKAATRSANREAVGYYEQALEAIGHLPEGREKTELSIDVRLDLRPSMLPLGAQDRMSEHLTQAESLAVRLGDKWRLARVYADLNAHYVQFGENLLAIGPGEQALAIANELGDFTLQLMVQERLARTYYGLPWIGD